MLLSHIRAGIIHMPHVDSCVIKKVSSDFCALAARVREMFQEGFIRHHLLLSFIHFFKQKRTKASGILPSIMPLALQSPGSSNTTHTFHCESLHQLFDPPFHISTPIVCERSCCIRSKLFVVRSDCYSSHVVQHPRITRYCSWQS